MATQSILASALQGFLRAAWEVTLELAPWLLLGTAIAAVLHVALPERWIHTHLRGRWAPLKAVLVGVPMPLCSCGVIPAGLGLKKDGASNGAALGFLISTPQTGVDSIFVSASFLGWPFALFKLATAAITGVVGGLLADRVEGAVQLESGADAERTDAHKPVAGGALAAMLDHGLEVLRSIWRWLVFGVLVSAAIEQFLPPEAMQAIGGLGAFGAAVAALVISLPLYVCATASVPIAAALVAGGLPAGAALVFLMAGPATNVATLGAVFRGFGSKVLGIYLSTLIVGSVGFGMLFDRVLPTAVEEPLATMDHGAWWQTASAVVLLLVLMSFASKDLGRWMRGWSRRSQSLPESAAVEVAVTGMHCNSCVVRLESALQQTDGIDRAEVSLETGTATVYGSASSTAVREVVEATGFGTG